MSQAVRVAGVEALMKPRSVAIIGASAQPGSIGERPIRYLRKHGFKGQIFPINPKYQELFGLPCYPGLQAVPGKVDLALVALSMERVFQALEECVQKGVTTATVFASGFAEAGGDGIERQAQLKAFAQRTGLRICGPNCIGTINIKDGVAATFSNAAEVDRFLPGKVGILAQSGGLAGSILDRAQSKGLGINYVVSSGNEVDLEAADYIDFMLADPDTAAVMAFVEGFKDGRKFAAVADRALEMGKALVILKGGRSEKGQMAAASHTGSLAGSDKVCDTLFRQKGVSRVDDLDSLVDTAILFANSPLPQGNRIGIFAPSGGAGVIMADKCEENGLKLVDLSPTTKEGLSKLMPAFGSISNPLDPTAQGYAAPDAMLACLDVFVRDQGFDTILVQIPTVSGEFAANLARGIVKAKGLTDRAYAVLCSSGASSEPAYQVFRESNVPYFNSFTNCFQAIGAAVKYNRRLKDLPDLPASSAVQAGALGQARDWLRSEGSVPTEYQSKKLLSCYGIPVTKEALAANLEQALEAAQSIGYPVVLKVQSPQILHKTDAKVVRLNVGSPGELEVAYREVVENAFRWNPEAQVQGVLVQEMAPPGTEVIVGMSRDEQFGPVLLFGLGGIFVEVFQDVAYRMAPLTEEAAREMIRETKGASILEGARGRPAADVNAVVDVLLKLSHLAGDLESEISQIDINPLIVYDAGHGVKAVDALVIRG